MNLKIQKNLCAVAASSLMSMATLAAPPCEDRYAPSELLQEHNVLVLYYCNAEASGTCPTASLDFDFDNDGNDDHTNISQDNESFEIAMHYQLRHPNVIVKNLADFGFQYTHKTNSGTFTPVPLEGEYANRWFITPEAYEAWMRAPLSQFIADHNANETDPLDPTDDILAIVTTRGVPTGIAMDFSISGCITHNSVRTKTSVEGALARMNTGMVGEDALGNDIEFTPDDNSDGDYGCNTPTGGPQPRTINNPYAMEQEPFKARLLSGCIQPEEMFLVTRLDSDVDDATNDGTPDVMDPTPATVMTNADVKTDFRTDEVKALIDRTQDPILVNQYGTTMVVDELTNRESSAATIGASRLNTYNYLSFMRDRGWCVYFNGWDNERGTTDGNLFMHGPDDTGIGCPAGGFPGPDNGQVGTWRPGVEGVYTDAPVVLHIGYGRNHANTVSLPATSDSEPPGMYPHLERQPHAAGFTRTNESFSGFSLHTPEYLWKKNTDPQDPDFDVVEPYCIPYSAEGRNIHGQALNWIAAGGSGAMARVVGGSDKTSLEYFVTNYYEEGLTYAEAAYTEIRNLGSAIVPIGDPLARVIAINPDIHPLDAEGRPVGDGDVDSDDVQAFALTNEFLDLDCDGDVDTDDEQYILDIAGAGGLWPNGRNCDEAPTLTYGDMNGLPEIPGGAWSPGSSLPAGCDLRGDANGDGFIGKSVNDKSSDLRTVISFLNCGRDTDLNGDGTLNHLDILTVMCNWGTVLTDVATNAQGETDGVVTTSDYLAVVAAIGQPCNDCAEDVDSGQDVIGNACADGEVTPADAARVLLTIGNSADDIAPPDLTPDGEETLLILNDSNNPWNDPLMIDCDNDGVFDQCQIADDPSLDAANGNMIIDSCGVDLPCPADIRPEGAPNDIVNIDDLLAVVNAISTQDLEGDITPDNGDGTFGNGVVNFDDLLALIAAFGPCPTGTDAEVNPPPAAGLLAVQAMDFSQGYIDENGNVQGDATAVGNAWATFSQTWDVYRVWAEVPSSSTEVDSISGSEDDNHSLIIANKSGSYYNNSYGNDKAPNASAFTTEPELAFDTFVTLGHATSAGGSTDIEGSLNLTANIAKEDLIWFKTGGVLPVPGGSTGWRILVGQFTVPKGKTLSGAMRVIGDGLDDYVVFTSATP